MSAVPLDQGHRPGLARLGQGDGPAVGIRVGPELRQPVGEREGRISQGAGERLLQLGWTRVAAKLHQEIADRGTRKPGSQMSGEKKHGRHAQQRKRDPADFVPSRRADRQHDGCRDQSRPAQGRNRRRATRARVGPDGPTPSCARRGRRRPRGRRPRSQLVEHERDVSVATRDLEQQPHEIEAEDDGVPADDDEAIEAAHEPSSRIRKKNMEEDHGEAAADPRRAREAPRRPPRPAVRARAPGRQRPARDRIGSRAASTRRSARSRRKPRRSSDESRVDVREGAVLAGQAQLVRASGCDESGECQGDDDRSGAEAPESASVLRRTLVRH